LKQKSVVNELENWNIQELECDEHDSECPDYDIHRCKAPFTDMAFDLRDHKEVHKNCSHAHSNINILLMERIAIFRQKMPARCKKSTIDAFDNLMQKLLDLTSSDCKSFKIYRFDPFADAMLLILANEIEMPRNVFLDCLSIETRLVPSKITEVKKYSCYRKIKALFDKTLAKKIK